MQSDNNPYIPVTDAVTPIRINPKRFSTRFVVCAILWCFGAFQLSVVCAVDAMLSNSLTGSVLYLILVASPCVTLAASACAPVSARVRILAFMVSLVLMAMQFLSIGILMLSLTGAKGIH